MTGVLCHGTLSQLFVGQSKEECMTKSLTYLTVTVSREYLNVQFLAGEEVVQTDHLLKKIREHTTEETAVSLQYKANVNVHAEKEH